MTGDCRDLKNPSHCLRKTKRARDFSIDGHDFISSLPNDILHRILSLLPTDLAIKTSVLSKRWRHVWSKTPCLFFERVKASRESINQTLARYSGEKIMSFHLKTIVSEGTHLVNTMMEFAISRNVEKFTLKFDCTMFKDNNFPDCFFNNSSLKQLNVECHSMIIPKTTVVSWTSLKNLSLRYVRFYNESLVKIISGCPMLESLTLKGCDLFRYLDLSKSPRLSRLDIDCSLREPMQIRAPHIRYLRLRNSEAGCSLVDVSSLTEANLEIYFSRYKDWSEVSTLRTSFLQVMVKDMLEKLQNVEKLTVGMEFLHILTLSELFCVPLPTLKVKTLILETKLLQSVVHGIARLVQSSPGLKKITVYTIKPSFVLVQCVNRYLESTEEFNPDISWRLDVVDFPTRPCDSEVVEPKRLVSFMELLLVESIALETMVVYKSGFKGKRFLINSTKKVLVEAELRYVS